MTMSGSSVPAIHDSAKSSCSFVRSLARYAPHSIVCSDTLTPTALRFDCMTVDMATGACMPEPDSGTHKVIVKLLAEAGYPNGFTTTLWVPESGSGMQAPVAMSTVMQSNLKAVGVNVSLQTMEWGAYLAKLRTKEQELFALSWMAGTEDPDMVMYPLLHSSQWTPVGPNRALYKNARFDALLQQARLTTDEAKRAQLYKEAQRILVDEDRKSTRLNSSHVSISYAVF